MRIKQTIKRMPIIGKLMTSFYRNVIFPLKQGYFRKLKYYNKHIKQGEIKCLRNLGLSKIKKKNFNSWKFDNGKDHSFRRYYLAIFDGEKCFVKISNNDVTVLNEICVFETISQFDFSPKVFLSRKNINNSYIFVQEYVAGLKEMSFSNENQFQDVCKQFANILALLKTHNLVHCDIHKGNLMIQKKTNKLYLLDFGISHFSFADNCINYIARPGTFFRYIGGSSSIRRYDDAYSFVCEVERLGTNQNWFNNPFYKEILSRIDTFYCDIKLQGEENV